MNPFARYARWLHLRWPAGTIEPLPAIGPDGATVLPGVLVVGDLTGVPLLKFALDGGARAARRIAEDPTLRRDGPADAIDVVILGAGVAGFAAAVEARRRGLSFRLIESSEPLTTLVNFPRRKPIFTLPAEMTPEGSLQVTADVKEGLIHELREQTERAGVSAEPGRAERIERAGGGGARHARGGGGGARHARGGGGGARHARGGGLLRVTFADREPLESRRVIVAIGRSGNVRRLGVPGETLDKVTNRLHDPSDFAGRRALVIGGGDAAIETAVALTVAGADVTLAHRGPELARPKPENLARLERLRSDPRASVSIEHASDPQATSGTAMEPTAHSRGRLELRLATRVRAVRDAEVELEGPSGAFVLPNDVVFTMIGRDPPLEFFRRSGIPVAGRMTAWSGAWLGVFLLFCAALFDWKSGGALSALWYRKHWFPTDLPDRLAALGGAVAEAARDRRTLLGTLAISASSPSFTYTLAYSVAVLVFGIRRIQRRRTPYVRVQTITLMAIQIVPLFLLPELLLPWMDARGWLPGSVADALFPRVAYGHGREFWRAYGFILAWPLDVYNVFTPKPLPAWLAIAFVQTFVLLPLGIYFFGKGVYCGWVCSCGALAETLGDTQRHKMPHGPGWNRLNLAGQVVLAVAVIMLGVRIVGWVLPDGNPLDRAFYPLLMAPYTQIVDIALAGVLGYGLYFWFSGRVWCRFFCPLAALMNVYARFTSFRIFADKPKCISCGRCTAVCHQGIDVMSFANKGQPMADPQCVRCSACVETCPTGVLSFGRIGSGGLIQIDTLTASPVRGREPAQTNGGRPR